MAPSEAPRVGLMNRALRAIGLQRALPAAAIAARSTGKRVFHAAGVNPLTVNLFAQTLSANDELKGDIRRLKGLSRRLTRDTALGARIPKLFVEQIIGPYGIRLQSRVEKRVGGLNQGMNRAHETSWAEWGERGTCTVDGSCSWVDALELHVFTLVVDGEVLWRIVRGAPNAWGFALEPLDTDLIDETFTGRWTNGNEVIMGIEVDRYGRPVAYHLWTRHPSEFGGDRRRERVLASDIIHDFIGTRAKQRRGLPFATPILLDAGTLAAFLEASTHAARIGASRIAAIEKDKDYQVDDDQEFDEVPDEVSPGQVYDLAPGSRLASIDWQYPTGEIDPFVRIVSRFVAAGYGVSYAAATGDLTGANYSSLRAGRLTELDVWRRMQRMVIERFCTVVHREWLSFAVMANKLPARKNMRDYLAVKWQPRGWVGVDPLKDQQAQDMKLANLLTTRRRILAEEGEDLEEILEERAEEEKLLQQLELQPTVAVKSKTPKNGDPADDAEDDDDTSDADEKTKPTPVRMIA